MFPVKFFLLWTAFIFFKVTLWIVLATCLHCPLESPLSHSGLSQRGLWKRCVEESGSLDCSKDAFALKLKGKVGG